MIIPGFPDLILPQGVKFDGIQPGPAGNDILQFTDHAEGPAKGATFGVPVKGITSVAIARKTAFTRLQFRTTAGAPIAPLYQRAPRQFAAPDSNHSR